MSWSDIPDRSALSYWTGVDEVNFDSNIRRIGQSFLGNGEQIEKVKVRLKKAGSPTGYVYAFIYEHSGTFGTSSVGTGTGLATSAAIVPSNLPSSFEEITFHFNTSYLLVKDTPYVMAIYYTSSSGGNYITIEIDTNGSHAGNASYYRINPSPAWTAYSLLDINFEILTNKFTAATLPTVVSWSDI